MARRITLDEFTLRDDMSTPTLERNRPAERRRATFVEHLEPQKSLMAAVEVARLCAARKLESTHRSTMGQFLSPANVAEFMASMYGPQDGTVRLLDAGAGIGSLSAAFVAEICSRKRRPAKLRISAYEIDSTLLPGLRATLTHCQSECRNHHVDMDWEVLDEDFIESGAAMLGGNLFHNQPPSEFDCAILNPPYRKIRSNSTERHLLRALGVETSNLYAGFLAIAIHLLREGGEMVAITPRSFCNGPYFRSFRRQLLSSMRLDRIHVYGSRRQTFRADNVLQENIVYHAVKQRPGKHKVVVSSSQGPDDQALSRVEMESDELVDPADPNLFIRVVTTELERRIAHRMAALEHSLASLGISVSTGRVVEFRARAFLRSSPEAATVPLIYPGHFHGGAISWPNPESRKPNALIRCAETEDLLIDSDFYVLTKRFSTKEEPRRLVAAVFDPRRFSHRRIGFENHLNYFHHNGRGLSPLLAKGLAGYLNSTMADSYFRQFNGHTQVNATDLRSLSYPSRAQLEALGREVGGSFPEQAALDRLVERILNFREHDVEAMNPVFAKKKIAEAMTALRELDLPKAQLNERSALALLALLDLRPESSWRKATNPMRGITQLMSFMADQYGKIYAPNTRETIRKDTIHHFVRAGLVVKNPDKPRRPTNSPKTVYQISPIALTLLKVFQSRAWPRQLKRYLASGPSLRNQYARERRMERLPLRLAGGKSLTLSPGGQSRLVKQILDDFCPVFASGAEVVYIGDTANKWAYFESSILEGLGIEIPEHGKMPDVVLFQREQNWLFLIEAVSSRGPMDAKRQMELRELFLGSSAGLVFVTAFRGRADLPKHLAAIAWETEVWIAESPTHLIHFDGERFLGPFQPAS